MRVWFQNLGVHQNWKGFKAHRTLRLCLDWWNMMELNGN